MCSCRHLLGGIDSDDASAGVTEPGRVAGCAERVVKAVRARGVGREQALAVAAAAVLSAVRAGQVDEAEDEMPASGDETADAVLAAQLLSQLLGQLIADLVGKRPVDWFVR